MVHGLIMLFLFRSSGWRPNLATPNLDIDNSHRIIIRRQYTPPDASGKVASASTALCSRLFPCSALLRPSPGRRLFAGPSGAEVLSQSATEGICFLYEESPIQ